MGRNKGIAYWIDDYWRRAVRVRLAEKEWDLKTLAGEAKIGESGLSEVLNGKRHTITNLPRIHKVLGFPQPSPPLLPEIPRRIMEIFAKFGGDPEAETRAIRMFEDMLALARVGAPQNAAGRSKPTT